MLEKLIENWLDSANERAFQVPFAQTLASQGHEVLYISPHGILEQGKDLITRGPNGTVCAYQLKSGSITTSVWQDIEAELSQLCRLGLVHPSLSDSEKDNYEAYLVCSGRIGDKARFDIETLNQSLTREKRPVLRTITGGELLQRFVNAQNKFLPQEPRSFHEFLSLLLWDGTDFLPAQKIANFLEHQLPSGTEKITPRNCQRMLAANLVICGYVLGPFANSQNHVAVAHGWLMFALHAAALEEALQLPQKWWKPTFHLAMEGVRGGLERLTKEALSRDDWTEGEDPLLDASVRGFRRTRACGWMAAWELFKATHDPDYERNELLVDRISGELPRFRIATEADVPHLLAACWLVSTRGSEGARAEWTVASALASIAKMNAGPGQGPGLANAYYDADWHIEYHFSADRRRSHDDDFRGRSMSAGALIDWLARRLRRQTLADLWYDLSALQIEEFFPDPPWQWIRWHAPRGELQQRLLGRPQSWELLREEAGKRTFATLPAFLRDDGALGLLASLAYPHRFNRTLLAAAEAAIGPAT